MNTASFSFEIVQKNRCSEHYETLFSETPKSMKFTKAKTSEFRFSVTDLIPVDNGPKLKKDLKKLSRLDAAPKYGKLNNIAGSLESTSLDGHKIEVAKTDQLRDVKGNFKVLLGKEKDGAVLDLDTFLRVQQWVEDASKQLILEQTVNNDIS